MTNHTAGDDFEVRVREILEMTRKEAVLEYRVDETNKQGGGTIAVESGTYMDTVQALAAIRQAIAQCPALVDEVEGTGLRPGDQFASARNELRAELRAWFGLGEKRRGGGDGYVRPHQV